MTKFRPSLALAAFVSGAAALAGEVVWLRYLSLVFGITTHAVAAALCAWMLGAALGSWHAGRAAARSANPARLLALLQLTLGAYLLASPWIYGALAEIAAMLGRNLASDGAPLACARFLIALAALLPAAYAAGGTVPVLLQALARRARLLEDDIGWHYGANTLGGSLGALAAGWLLLPLLGLSRTLWLCAGSLAILGIGLLLFMREVPAAEAGSRSEKTPRNASALCPHAKIALIVAGISGGTSLAYEVFWTRALTYFFRDSIYDLSLVLAVFLAGLGIGSFLAAGWLRRGRDALSGLALSQIALALAALGGLFLLHRFPFWLNDLQTNTALARRFGEHYWTAALALRAGWAAALMLAPAILLGMALPLAARIWVGEGDAPGRRFGALAAINTLGAAAGALAAGFVVIPALGLWRGVCVTAVVNLVLGAFALAATPVPGKSRWLMAAVAAGGLAFAALPRWDRARMSAAFLAPEQNIESLLAVRFYREDAAGLASVVELAGGGPKFLVTNRLYTQNSSVLGGMEDHRRLGMIPLLLHARPERVLIVGLGAGVTLRGALAIGPGEVEVAELSPGVIEAARTVFGVENAGAPDNPRVRVAAADGRNFLATANKSYDVIILDILFPMSSGSSAVFSREYYELCRARLRPGGMVCQWLPAHQLSADDVRTIAATFQSVFPHASLWHGLVGETAVVGLVGALQPQTIDYAALAARYRYPALRAELAEVNLGDPALLFSHYIVGRPRLAQFSAGARLDTDDRPVLEFSAPKIPIPAREQGLRNLAELAALSEGEGPAVSDAGVDRRALEARLPRAIEAKRAIVESYRLALAGDRDGRLRVLREALANDPQNPDLREALVAAETSP